MKDHQPLWTLTIGGFVYREHMPLRKISRIAASLEDEVLGIAIERETSRREER